MADSTTKILSAVLFLVLISQGYAQCALRDLSVRQSPTGVKVQGKSEWRVTITNKCPCVQANVTLNCNGFQTTERINPSILKVSGRSCVLGQSIYRDPISFKYAWDHSFPLNPVSSKIACSYKS